MKSRKQTSYTARERDVRLDSYVGQSIATMHVCRHSGSPESGLLIGRSVFPLLVETIHRRLADQHDGRSLNSQLERLYALRVIDELTHTNFRRAAASLGDFGSGRDLHDVITACEMLRTLAKTHVTKAKAAKERRPGVMAWFAQAADLLLPFGAWKS